MLTLQSRAPLRDGQGQIPYLGLGIWQLPPGKITQAACESALAFGYRHIDTARYYDNEQDVGAALRASRLPRSEVFVTTKVRNEDQGYDAVKRAVHASLKRMGLDYVDLYLIHWPVPEAREDTWEALIELREQGLCRAIGVSNFTIQHLEQLLSRFDVVPAVNQVECHVFLQQRELDAYCRKHGILVEAYSPLVHGERLDHPVIRAVAHELGKTPAQVLIRFALERGMVVLPRSRRPERIAENATVFDFELGAERLARLNALDDGFRTCWDPTTLP